MYQIGTTLLDPAIMGEVIEDGSHSRVVREAQTGVKGNTEVRIDLNPSRRLRLSGRSPWWLLCREATRGTSRARIMPMQSWRRCAGTRRASW